MKTSLLIAAICSAACCGCNRSDGPRLARIAGKLTQQAQELLPERLPVAGSLGLTAGASVQGRVRDRFQFDKYLQPLSIEIDAEGSTVHLRGNVDDPVLRRRAVEIAESTVGVEKVVDDLIVR